MCVEFGEQLTDAAAGGLVAFDFAWPSPDLGVDDEGLFSFQAGAELWCVLGCGEEFSTGEHEIAFAETFGWEAEAVTEFQFCFEEVGL